MGYLEPVRLIAQVLKNSLPREGKGGSKGKQHFVRITLESVPKITSKLMFLHSQWGWDFFCGGSKVLLRADIIKPKMYPK